MRSYLEGLVRNEHPERHDVRVTNLTEIEGGWETRIYRLDLSYRQNGASHSRKLVARFYPGPRGAESATREAAVLRAVAAAAIPVPELDLVAREDSEHGAAVILMERIPGAVLRVAAAESPDLIGEMARCLEALHRLPVSAVFGQGIDSVDSPGFVAAEIGAMESAVDRYGLVDFRPLLEWLAGPGPRLGEPAVLHNDYHPDNIIVPVEGGGLVIIDWTFAGNGDYRLDLAWSALWTGAMSGQAARARLLAAYEEAAGAPIESLEHFEVLKLGARLLTVMTWLEDSVDPPVPKLTEAAIRGDYKPTVLVVYDRVRELTGIRLPVVERL